MSAGAEERLERGLRTSGLVAGPLLAAAVYAWNPGSHDAPARKLLSILALAVCFWLTEAIPLPATSLLASSLAIVTGVAGARAVLAPYADPVIFLFAGTFLLAEAFRAHGLDLRVTASILRIGRVGASPGGLMGGFGTASSAVSTCLSNTATAALMTPIAVGAVRRRLAGPDPGWGSGVLLMVAYGASVGGMATLIGTPPNLLVAGFLERLAGVPVGFTAWLLFGLPVASILLVASLLVTRLCAGRLPSFAGDGAVPVAPRGPDAGGEGPGAARESEGPGAAPTAGARWTIAAFALAGVLWTVPGLAAAAWGPQAAISRALADRLPEAGVALLCSALLFVAPVDWRARRFALSWEEGRRVNWGILLLFGGGLSLGTLAESTGLARWVGGIIQQSGLASTPAGLLAISVAGGILVSEFASNTASATLLVPVVIAAAQAAEFDPVRPALGVGLAATCGFVFPVSTPPNAIVYGTGLVPLRRMIRAGVLLDLIAFVVIWLGLLALTPLLPASPR